MRILTRWALGIMLVVVTVAASAESGRKFEITPLAQRPNRAPAAKMSKTQIVMLGTGTPGFDIDQSGPATAIVVNGTAYLVDFGAGVMRRAQGAYEKGVAALSPREIHVAFLTHLHQDHTTGYPDLIYSPLERKGPLEVYGPEGIRHMTEHLIEAYKARRPLARRGNPDVQVNVDEITAGVVYRDNNRDSLPGEAIVRTSMVGCETRQERRPT